MEQIVRATIEPIRLSLQADGGDLECVAATAEEVRIKLILGPDACMDCILPREVLEEILLSQVRERIPSVQQVKLQDPRVQE